MRSSSKWVELFPTSLWCLMTADKLRQIKVFCRVILRQWEPGSSSQRYWSGLASPHYVMSFSLQPASQPAASQTRSHNNLSWRSVLRSYRLAPDNQQSYGPTPSWRLFALWALPALLPIKILTCWHAWMLGSAGRSSYWKMPDILVKYANTNAQISCQTKRASSRMVSFNCLIWVNLGSVIWFY